MRGRRASRAGVIGVSASSLNSIWMRPSQSGPALNYLESRAIPAPARGASFFRVRSPGGKVRGVGGSLDGRTGGRVSFFSPPQWGRNRFRRLGSLELAPGVIWQFTRCHREIKSRAPHCQLSPAVSWTFIFFRFRCPPRSFPTASAFFSTLLCWFFSIRSCFR